MLTQSEYLTFERRTPPDRKTPIVVVTSKSGGYLLGTIRWYGNWRQFCFMPEPATVFNKGCLTDINSVIDELMEERRHR